MVDLSLTKSYLKLPVEDTSSQAARTNAIIQSFIDILNNPAAFEVKYYYF